MKITDILSADSILADVSVDNKRQVLEQLSSMASSKVNIDERIILDALIERERLGTTGIGHGVALPHTRLMNIDSIFCAFFKVTPIDFESVDGKLVDLVFLLLVPESAGRDHLKALSCLSNLVRDEKVAQELRNAKNADELFKIIQQNEKDVD